MSGHDHDKGRANLPFIGISTLGKRPYQGDWSTIRAGARFEPRALREAATLFSFGYPGACDHEDDCLSLGPAVSIVHTDTETSHANIAAGGRAMRAAGALPVVIGGDHSSNIPCIRAFAGQGPIHTLQIDADLDCVDLRHGTRHTMATRCAARQNEIM